MANLDTRLPADAQIHFIGIGGAGMAPIARLLLAQGYRVSGSDIRESINTVRLKEAGATIFYRHDASNIRQADLAVVSTAILPTNEEWIAAEGMHVPIWRRARMLNYVMATYPVRVAVAGTHGKTSTTAMITHVLAALNQNPTFIVGSDITSMGTSSAMGTGHYFVAEADESDGSFLLLNPNISVVTNVEAEHMDYFKSEANLIDHFRQFLTQTFDQNGMAIVNHDDPFTPAITAGGSTDQIRTVGLTSAADIYASDIQFSPEGMRFQVTVNGESFPALVPVFGRHHIYNALCAVAVASIEHLNVGDAIAILGEFGGTKRRFQRLGEVNGIQIYDDYGHHPTEIKTTLDGVRQCLGGRLIVCFQPHRYSRTRDHMDAFSRCFDSADQLIVTEIYSAQEPKLENITAEALVARIRENSGVPVTFVAKKSDIPDMLVSQLCAGDIIITVGAGDIYAVGKELVNRLRSRAAHP